MENNDKFAAHFNLDRKQVIKNIKETLSKKNLYKTFLKVWISELATKIYFIYLLIYSLLWAEDVILRTINHLALLTKIC